ncbi:MAG: Nif3-like dinuclear metal center hexameric protein [Buchnera aphidicola (Chaetogeoica yunlongensis)]
MKNFELENVINEKLSSKKYNDFCPNGLQIEGCPNIKKIITGVTACQSLIDLAILNKANAIIVHHGIFWNNDDRTITGMNRKRIKSLLKNDINLYSWHLPLDLHPILGNNIQIGKILNINIKGYITPMIPWGFFEKPITLETMTNLLTKKLDRIPLYYGANTITKKIYKVAWSSGKGQKLINFTSRSEIDTFLTGEVSEETIHYVRENNIHFFSIGHHASEIGGIQALTNWLKSQFNLNIKFININNPI